MQTTEGTQLPRVFGDWYVFYNVSPPINRGADGMGGQRFVVLHHEAAAHTI